jgi:glycosyltransferase 2 family protein
VVAVSLVFLFFAVHDSWGSVSEILSEGHVLLLTLGLSLIYVLGLYIVFTSWFYTLRLNSPVKVDFRTGAYVYAVSNVAKYLPGNVFHFAGRQILGARLGWSHAAIARATLLEIAALLVGVGLVILMVALSSSGVAAVRMVLGDGSPLGTYWRFAVIAVPIAAGGAGVMLFKTGLPSRLFGVPPRAFLVVLSLVTGFFVLNSIMAIVFVRALPNASPAPPWAMLVIAYLLAWLAGFVVPGAPGGLGVRETVLVLLLSMNPHGAETISLALGLGMRFVSTLGDAFFAGLAYLLARSPAVPPTAPG